jgi:hypothetical protein
VRLEALTKAFWDYEKKIIQFVRLNARNETNTYSPYLYL